MEPDTETLDMCLPYALCGGNDFRPEWRTEAVVGLARGIAEDGAFERMPILADALEEAGCTDIALLRHCRDPIPHDHQCWALGLALRPHARLPTPLASIPEPPTWGDDVGPPMESLLEGGSESVDAVYVLDIVRWLVIVVASGCMVWMFTRPVR